MSRFSGVASPGAIGLAAAVVRGQRGLLFPSVPGKVVLVFPFAHQGCAAVHPGLMLPPVKGIAGGFVPAVVGYGKCAGGQGAGANEVLAGRVIQIAGQV